MQVLNNREKLLYLHEENDFKLTPDKWKPYLYPANKLKGSNVYYWAYIDKLKVHSMQTGKIVSYQGHLNQL